MDLKIRTSLHLLKATSSAFPQSRPENFGPVFSCRVVTSKDRDSYLYDTRDKVDFADYIDRDCIFQGEKPR